MAQSLKMRTKRHGGSRPGAGRKGDDRWYHLVSIINDDLDAIGSAASPKMVRSVVRDRRVADPSFHEDVKEETLVRYYFRYRNRPAPIASKQPTISQTALTPADGPASLPTAPVDLGRHLFLLQKWASWRGRRLAPKRRPSSWRASTRRLDLTAPLIDSST
jgi:hypothetical protein